MKKIYIRIICLAMVLVLPFVFSSCFEEEKIVIINAKSYMFVGEEQNLEVYSNKTDERYDKLLSYKSSDPSVATVNERGVVTATAPGDAVIYVQASTNSELKAELNISVTYKTVSTSKYNVTAQSGKTDASSYPFWSANGYSSRVSNWAIKDIAKILITKGTDEYVFSEAFNDKKVTCDKVILVADWGNNDVPLIVDSINSNVFAEMLKKHELGSGVSIGTITRLSEEFAKKIDKKINTYKGKIELSEMPANREYRVSIVMDYKILKVKNPQN